MRSKWFAVFLVAYTIDSEVHALDITTNHLKNIKSSDRALFITPIQINYRSTNDTDDITPVIQNKHDERWWKRYRELQEYCSTHGDCLVPISNYPPNPSLSQWVSNQRKMYKKYQLDNSKVNQGLVKSRIDYLNRLGFVWDVRLRTNRQKWLEMYNSLVIYKQVHSDDLDPDPDPYSKLGLWVRSQRNIYMKYRKSKSSRKNKEVEWRIEQLSKIGFSWGVPLSNDTRWNSMYKELQKYKYEHGNCLVPTNYQSNPALGQWVHNQRKLYHKYQYNTTATKKVSTERFEKLVDIDFVFNAQEDHWETMFEGLQNYKQKHGDFLVSRNQNKVLYSWMMRQRERYRNYLKGEDKRTTTIDRIQSLQAIGFDLDS